MVKARIATCFIFYEMKAILIILDSVGIGEAPDADKFGDIGANTLANTASAVGGIKAPVLQKMGLGNIPALLPGGLPISGISTEKNPIADFGAMLELSQGKDTITGHWEIAGIYMKRGFKIFPPIYPSFPFELVNEFEKKTGRVVIGNKAASGTAILEELGSKQIREGAWLVYTSADSVFQIAAHEETIPREELYKACETARELCNEYRIGRVIARPFTGIEGSFTRTDGRRDYSFPLPERTILDNLHQAGINVIGVGKIEDIFNKRGLTKSFHTTTNKETQKAIFDLLESKTEGLIFANLIDFDMLHGHRRAPEGYAKAIEQTDEFINNLLPMLAPEDILIISADHGNDPTFKGTDHTREYVPLLVHRPGQKGRKLGIRQGFFDIAQSLATFFGIKEMPQGVSFLE